MDEDENLTPNEEEPVEPVGTLTVEDRSAPAPRGTVEARGSLLSAFRRAGWQPGVRAEVAWDEFLGAAESRALTWAGDVEDVSALRRQGVGLAADRRYVWPVIPTQAVDSGVTSVQVVQQTTRTLPDTDDVIRDIDAVTRKPEVDSELDLVPVPMKQIAAIQSGVPNVLLLQEQFRSVVGVDLRLTLNEALDALVLGALAGSPFHDPTTDPLLVSIRKAISVLQDAGYDPNVVVLQPSDAEALDLLTTSGPEEVYVFGAGRFAPGDLFGLQVRISKSAEAPAVLDTRSLGRLYTSPISLQTFEEAAGSTNSSTVRLEGTAAVGVERADAAVRIAAS
jgi:hypothetical protein